MTNRTSLPDCARIHPGQPSQIKVSFARSRKGNSYQRCVCSTCKSVTARAQPRNANTFEARLRTEHHGVVRLAWAPPERLIAALESESV